MVTKEQFEATVKELRANSDFFDPIMLDEFSGEGSLRPTTIKQVIEDFDMSRLQIKAETGVDLTPDEMFSIISFLEGYSDVDLYAPSRGVRMDSLIESWWEMFQDFSTQFTGDDVIQEIVDEIDSGDAHLLTRNELVEFILSERVLTQEVAEAKAKAWFVKKGYEHP